METMLMDLIIQWASKQSWGIWMVLGFSVIGSLNVVATSVILMTPTKKDDEWLLKFQEGKISGLIWKAFRNFALVKQKSEPSGKL